MNYINITSILQLDYIYVKAIDFCFKNCKIYIDICEKYKKNKEIIENEEKNAKLFRFVY